MAIGLVMKETMSGWLKLDEEARERDFSFSLRAFTPKIFSTRTPRPFRGMARLDGGESPCEGELTLYADGPHYWLDFRHPELGMLHVEGKKTYGKGGLLHSLVTCPMEVFRDGRKIGEAEVAYRDSMVAFPFKSLRLAREENAFGEYGELQ